MLGQASGLPLGKPQSHSETQLSIRKNVLSNQQPAELLSEVPIRDKVIKKKYLYNLPGFGNLEPQNVRVSEEPALYSQMRKLRPREGKRPA